MTSPESSGAHPNERSPEYPDKERVEREWEKLKEKIGSTDLSFEFVFGPHGDAEEIKRIKEQVEQADIILSEGLVPEGLKGTVQKLSAHEISLEEATERVKREKNDVVLPAAMAKITSKDIGSLETDAIFLQMMESLHATGKPWALIDASLEEVASKLPEDSSAAEKTRSDLGPLAEAADILNIEGQFHKIREDLMLLNIAGAIGKVVEEHPELQGKENLRIAIFLGSVHTRMFRSMRSMGHDVKRVFLEGGTVFSAREQVLRAMAMGQPLRPEAVRRAFLHEVLFPMAARLQLIEPDISKCLLYVDVIVNKFTDDEIKKIMDTLGSGDAQLFYDAIAAAFAQKGIEKVPGSSSDLDDLIAQELKTDRFRKTR